MWFVEARVDPPPAPRQAINRNSISPHTPPRDPIHIMKIQLHPTSWVLALGLVAGCSSGSSSGSSSPGGTGLAVNTISVLEGAVWKINRAIDITFNKPVDLSTVNFNTIQIIDGTGVSATGVFLQPQTGGQTQTNVVRFQPNCPEEDDFSDAGLQVNTAYQLRVLGASDTTQGITVRSTAGLSVQEGQLVNFTTPDSTLPEVLFLDTVPGPPAVIVRELGLTSATEVEATHLQLGGDPTNRQYFDANGLGILAPLNKYSDPSSQWVAKLYFNQPVLASSNNINSNRIRFEYRAEPNEPWEVVPTQVELDQNCVESGSILDVRPLGIVPQGSEMRLVVRQGFVDLTGDPNPQDNTDFAEMNTETVLVNNLPALDSDELLEPFVLGGEQAGSLEDLTTPLGDPRADWGKDGRLEASFDFGGTGGPNGTFDYHVQSGTSVSISTTTATIQGGPGGTPQFSQTVINGVMDVRDLFVPADSQLIFVGPNPVTILASGNVQIDGLITINGGNNDGVGTLNTTFIPEPGAAGNAGGGKGGTGSFLTSSSTPRGGSGFGPGNLAGRGGQGGESGFHQTIENARRPGGGGGGRLGEDVFYDHDPLVLTDPLRQCQTLIGMDSEPGFAGGAMGLGAISQSVRAQGGMVGPDPFRDSRSDNNFFGTLITSSNELLIGELDGLTAGSGGGAGGDAATTNQYPRIPFQPGGDEKGSGGGGGAGGISILAIGKIEFGPDGSLTAIGGHGGGGENQLFFDRVGGGSGGGSGGHVVLSSANSIAFNGMSTNSGDEYRDDLVGHRLRPITAVGGEGGAGHENAGGARETGPQVWQCDAIPLGRVNPIPLATGIPVPPLRDPAAGCFSASLMLDWNDEEGPVLGAGGDGSPGLVQLHVDDPDANIQFDGIAPGETWADADVTKVIAPRPLGWYAPGAATDKFVAFFGRISVAQSEWIPLGLARVDPEGGLTEQVSFFFGGTDSLSGTIPHAGSEVQLIAPVVGPLDLEAVGTLPYVEPSGLRLFIDGSGLAAAYQANPSLMRGFSIELTQGANSASFPIAGAVALGGGEIRLDVNPADNLRDNFLNGTTALPAVQLQVRPHFYRVSTGGVLDAYPAQSEISIFFDATLIGPNGLPDESQSFSANAGLGSPAANINALNTDDWDFFRFRTVFNLNSSGTTVDPNTERPALEFLRVPFTY